MKHRKRLVVGGIVLFAAAAGTGVGVAVAGGDDGDAAATGPGADKATAAALAHVPGTANSVERDSENGATWEVEVTRADGGTVDVRLDDAYGLVVVEGDDENGDS